MEKKSFIEAVKTPENIKIKVSTRFGGYSQKPYDSLNMGYFTGDDIYTVIKNYKYYENISGTKNIVTLNQVHGVDVLEVNKETASNILFSNADGLFTKDKNLPLGVITADCLPVILAGREYISSLHCGWRSLNGGIIDNSFNLFKKYGDFPEYAYIGPGICSNCYEVRDDLVSQLRKEYEPEKALINIENGVYKLNLKQLAVNALKYNGLEENLIEISDLSSCCNEEFFSYRKDNGKTGRMVTTVERV